MCIRDSLNKLPEEALPASETQRERKETRTKLVAILVQKHPLLRGVIATFCDEPQGKSCARPAKTGRCGLNVKFHPFTREPTITRRKARRHNPRELPSSVDDRWKFPREEYRRMQTE
eukprot:8549015-Pyramimonas_sp.AAC.1